MEWIAPGIAAVFMTCAVIGLAYSEPDVPPWKMLGGMVAFFAVIVGGGWVLSLA